jgi:hypothetical protein
MIPLYWMAGGILVLVLAALGAGRCPGRSGIPLTLGGLGLGLSFLFAAALRLDPPVLSQALLSRLLWMTLLVTTPLWSVFSFRLGRENARRSGRNEKFSMMGLWAVAGLLAVGGLSNPPVTFSPVIEGGARFFLAAPFGRAAIVHAMAAIAIALWSLHATLNAARASGRRRVSLAVYSLVPVAVTSFYLLAETLLYEQLMLRKAMLLVPASIVSLGALALVLRLPDLGERSVAAEQSIPYTPAVPVALGSCLVALALLAEFVRKTGLGGSPGWAEGVSVLVLAVVFVFWVFSGLRDEIKRFANRGFYAARSDYKDVWQRVDLAIDTARTPADLMSGLEAALRATLGPLRVQIWLSERESGDLVPVGAEHLPRLPVGHPLRRAMQGGERVLVLAGGAVRVADIPLHIACEILAQRHGLRVFSPIRSGEVLVGLLGCGPAGGRTFHPEDLELLRLIGVRLGASVMGMMAGAGSVFGLPAPLTDTGAILNPGNDDAASRIIRPTV